jgi:hypothetical protein
MPRQWQFRPPQADFDAVSYCPPWAGIEIHTVPVWSKLPPKAASKSAVDGLN